MTFYKRTWSGWKISVAQWFSSKVPPFISLSIYRYISSLYTCCHHSIHTPHYSYFSRCLLYIFMSAPWGKIPKEDSRKPEHIQLAWNPPWTPSPQFSIGSAPHPRSPEPSVRQHLPQGGGIAVLGQATPFWDKTGSLSLQQAQYLSKNCPELYVLKFDTTYI